MSNASIAAAPFDGEEVEDLDDTELVLAEARTILARALPLIAASEIEELAPESLLDELRAVEDTQGGDQRLWDAITGLSNLIA